MLQQSSIHKKKKPKIKKQVQFYFVYCVFSCHMCDLTCFFSFVSIGDKLIMCISFYDRIKPKSSPYLPVYKTRLKVCWMFNSDNKCALTDLKASLSLMVCIQCVKH